MSDLVENPEDSLCLAQMHGSEKQAESFKTFQKIRHIFQPLNADESNVIANNGVSKFIYTFYLRNKRFICIYLCSTLRTNTFG